jgi:hypothetical protein
VVKNIEIKMKKLFILFTAFLFVCSSNTGVNWMSGDFKLALDAAREQNKPILVDFYSDT